MLTPNDVIVQTLGTPTIKSPLRLSTVRGDGMGNFVPDAEKIRFQVELQPGEVASDEIMFEKAGPRELIYFDPSDTRAAIVTCGGLCPGLNNVIRSVYLELYHQYGVHTVYGIRFGYGGFNPASKPPVMLTRNFVESIHKRGGSILGCSRGPEDTLVILDFLEQQQINLLFCVGGDGTQRGAHAIAQEALRRGMKLAVVGIPKTIDNDIPYVYRSFGFSTSIEKAKEIIDSAHEEANGAPNGISLVKLMGRHAGFITAAAAIASQEVNFVLVPEVPFKLNGDKGFLECLKRRILNRGHAVVVVAEGAGQDLIASESEGRDASGNVKLKDIGLYLKDHIHKYFEAQEIPINLKYFDPSYFIRSVPANCDDSLLCDQFARHAVHAAMAGKTNLLIGLWYNMFIHLPTSLATRNKKQISPESEFWMSALAATGQPARFV